MQRACRLSSFAGVEQTSVIILECSPLFYFDEIKDIKLGVRLLALNPMTLTAAIILLYLVALFLTVATLWPFSYPTQTIFPNPGS